MTPDWPHQIQLYNGIEEAWAHGSKSVCVQLPTGGGKTRIIRRIVEKHHSNKKVIYLVAHRKNLVHQLSNEIYDEAKIMHGLIMSGVPQIRYRVQVCSIQTLINRATTLPEPDKIIVDEAHHIKASSYMRLLNYFPDAKIAGFTATTARTDGSPLDDVFQDLLIGPPPKYLIENNFLSDFRYYIPFTVEVDDIEDEKLLSNRMDRPTITGDVIDTYREYANHTPAIASCVNIEHAENVAAMFRRAGYAAQALHSKLDEKFIDYQLKAFKAGKLKIICQVDMLGEGTDIPGAVTLLWLRHTQSLIIFLQHCGRVLRYLPGKIANIFDFVGNYDRFDFPDVERDWTLKGKIKANKGILLYKQCPKCYIANVPKKAQKCPGCGHEFAIHIGQGGGRRLPDERPGKLIDIRGKNYEQLYLTITQD